MRRDDIRLYLNPADRAELQALTANRNTPRKLVWRAEIVLATADGHGTFEIMRRANTSKPTVWRWQARYLDEGVDGLKRDKTRPSRVPPLPRETRLKVIAKTVQEAPPNATHWSRSAMAEAVGISPSSVGRIWAEAGLKPHLTKSFKVSNDPMFEEKVTDIVGLYLDPPERAVVLCVDEKSQIQALDRTQPGLPLKKGRAATMTHDYKRHGTTTLFAALDVKSGKVIGECLPRHRAKEFLRFLRRIDRHVPKSREVHLVLDNYATHKTPEVRAWLGQAPALQAAFHADQRVVAEPRGTVLRRDHVEAHPPRQLLRRRRPGDRHLRLPPAAQRQAEALHLDQDRRGHPGPGTPRAGHSR